MASATPSISHSAARKSLLDTAALFKASPAKEATGGAAAGAGNSEQNLPRFADALKLARRQATPETERTPIPQRETGPAEEPSADEVEKREGEPREVKAEKPGKSERGEKPEKPEPRKEAVHTSNRRSEKAPKRRKNDDDGDDAASETPAQDAGDDAPATDETATASDDASATSDTSDDAPDAQDATDPTQVPVAQVSAWQFSPMVSPQVPVPQRGPATPPAAPQADDQTMKTDPGTVVAQPLGTQQPQPGQQQPQPVQQAPQPQQPAQQVKGKGPAKFAVGPKQTQDATPAKADGNPAAAEKKPADVVQPEQTAAATDETTRPTLQLPKPEHPVHPQHPGHPDHPEKMAEGPTKQEVAPAAGMLQALQPTDAAASDAPRDASPASDSDPVKPTADAQGVGATAPAPVTPKLDQSAEVARAAQDPHAPDADPTFEQVVLGLRTKLDARSGKAEIRLEPPNLGPLHVSLQLNNGTLTAQFQSSSDLVRDLLKSNMEKLKSVLEGQGIAVDKLAVGTVESSPDKVVTQPSKLANSGAPQNDGRSAGQYFREQNGQKRSNGNAFGKIWRDANAEAPAAPVDLVG